MAFFQACNKSDPMVNTNSELELVSSEKINVSEASGLAINASASALFTVSDNTNNIYELSMSGYVVKEYDYNVNDVEFISII